MNQPRQYINTFKNVANSVPRKAMIAKYTEKCRAVYTYIKTKHKPPTQVYLNEANLVIVLMMTIIQHKYIQIQNSAYTFIINHWLLYL